MDSSSGSSNASSFRYKTRVAFHETDAMGVVHHSSYINFFEEARVAWLRAQGLMHLHAPVGELIFAVVDLQCRFAKPLKFEDEIEILVEARAEGARIHFRYAVYGVRIATYAAFGVTNLVAVTPELRPAKLPLVLRERLKSSAWSAAWPGDPSAH